MRMDEVVVATLTILFLVGLIGLALS